MSRETKETGDSNIELTPLSSQIDPDEPKKFSIELRHKDIAKYLPD